MINMMKKLYGQAIKTIVEAKYCILFVFVLYCGALITGWLFPEKFEFFEGVTEQLVEKFADKGALVFILKLFIHNLIATYFTMCLLVFFGLFPTTASVLNGLAVGWVAANASGATDSNIFLMLAPHGIFEWPAMMLGWGIGIWRGIGHRFTGNDATYAERLKQANMVYIAFVAPLLFFAAIIEGRYHIASELFGVFVDSINR